MVSAGGTSFEFRIFNGGSFAALGVLNLPPFEVVHRFAITPDGSKAILGMPTPGSGRQRDAFVGALPRHLRTHAMISVSTKFWNVMCVTVCGAPEGDDASLNAIHRLTEKGPTPSVATNLGRR